MLFLFIGILVTFVLVACADESSDDNPEDTAEESEETAENESEAPDDSPDEELVTLADEFINNITTGEYEAASQQLNETMKEELTPEALDEMWVTVQDQVGEYISHEYNSTQEAEGYQVILLDGLFENSDVVFQVTFDENQQIAGFYIQ